MSYFKVLGFEKEPFSTSPDPNFFYESRQHELALTNLLIELRLRRGLSVILGDIGTGKTTLSRKLVQLLKNRENFIVNIIMDPTYDSKRLFLLHLAKNFGLPTNSSKATVLDLKAALEKFLYQKGVEENMTIVLIVDEAQKLNTATLEILRVLLNYETNEFKLLQLILLGQMELYVKIMDVPNFLDRISFKYIFNPLDELGTRKMIEFRVKQGGYNGNGRLFSDEAIKEIYGYTRGYPRRISMLAHKAVKGIVMKNKSIVDEEIIREIIHEEVKAGW